MKTVSLFSGIGGLDEGFRQMGFDIIWANDNDRDLWDTYILNHPDTVLDTRSLTEVTSDQIPECDVIIGGPPCQSWSAGGANKGSKDKRGKLFYEYLRVIDDLKPKIFVAENVEGILRKTHRAEFENIIASFKDIGYDVKYQKLNAANYGVPQDRIRVIIVGIRNDINATFQYPDPIVPAPTLREAIYDIRDQAKGVKRTETIKSDINAYLDDTWSPQFMSRNRVRCWNEQAYTVPATGRQITIHPQAPKMVKKDNGNFEFETGHEHLYRRFTIQECARLQTFPDTYKLKFSRVDKGYKMLGNAVPVNLARAIAGSVRDCLKPGSGASKASKASKASRASKASKATKITINIRKK